MAKYVLKLYVAGRTTRSVRAINDLDALCEDELRGEYEIEVVDVLQDPQLAEDDRILATPTVVRALPEPVRCIIGDLSDGEKILVGLDLRSWP